MKPIGNIIQDENGAFVLEFEQGTTAGAAVSILAALRGCLSSPDWTAYTIANLMHNALQAPTMTTGNIAPANFTPEPKPTPAEQWDPHYEDDGDEDNDNEPHHLNADDLIIDPPTTNRIVSGAMGVMVPVNRQSPDLEDAIRRVKSRRLSPLGERKRAAKHLRAQGKTAIEISHTLGVSYGAARRLVNSKLPDFVKKDVAFLASKGANIKQIADAVGYPTTSILGVLGSRAHAAKAHERHNGAAF